jgi:hypothetical protein
MKTNSGFIGVYPMMVGGGQLQRSDVPQLWKSWDQPRKRQLRSLFYLDFGLTPLRTHLR